MQVNVPFLSSAYLPEAKPWVELCTRLTCLVTSSEPSLVEVTVGGWMRGKGRLVERAVKLGCVRSEAVNLINVQAHCSTKVTITESEESDVITVSCGGVAISGVVVGNNAYLSCVDGKCIGLFKLSGCVIVAKGTTLTDIVKEVPSISEVINYWLIRSFNYKLFC